MTDFLSAEALMEHVRALAQDIGPRPTGHSEEEQARDYIRRVLHDAEITDIEEMPFPAWDTWGYLLIVPASLSLMGNILGKIGRFGKLVGGTLTLASAYDLYLSARNSRQFFSFLYPKRQTANLIVRVPVVKEPQHRVVLIGHTDTNKRRGTFAPTVKRFLPLSMTAGIVLAAINGIAQIAQGISGRKKADIIQRASFWGLAAFLPLLLLDEKDGYIDGANDNATGVACLLGLGAHLRQNPLFHTEVWLAFTGAEEVGCLGIQELLDVYGEELADAWFIDFEMVGTKDVAYVTRHGVSYLSSYTPDAESMQLAKETSAQYPELGIYGRPMVIVEEVGALHSRGYRGICLVGVGEDGWLANWHQYSDNVDNIEPTGIERAARFALAMMRRLDEFGSETKDWGASSR